MERCTKCRIADVYDWQIAIGNIQIPSIWSKSIFVFRCTILFMRKWKSSLISSMNEQMLHNHSTFTSKYFLFIILFLNRWIFIVNYKHCHSTLSVDVHSQLRQIRCEIVTISFILIARNSSKKMITIDRGSYRLHVSLSIELRLHDPSRLYPSILRNSFQYYFPNSDHSIAICDHSRRSDKPNDLYWKTWNLCSKNANDAIETMTGKRTLFNYCCNRMNIIRKMKMYIILMNKELWNHYFRNRH